MFMVDEHIHCSRKVLSDIENEWKNTIVNYYPLILNEKKVLFFVCSDDLLAHAPRLRERSERHALSFTFREFYDVFIYFTGSTIRERRLINTVCLTMLLHDIATEYCSNTHTSRYSYSYIHHCLAIYEPYRSIWAEVFRLFNLTTTGNIHLYIISSNLTWSN
jgi:hypothetical protein